MTPCRTKWIIVTILLLAAAGAGFIGGVWFVKGRFQMAENESLLMFQHLASQNTADAYLRLMEAMESGDTNQTQKLTIRARVAVQAYVTESLQLRDAKGYRWSPRDTDVFTRAEKFAAKHPLPATNHFLGRQK